MTQSAGPEPVGEGNQVGQATPYGGLKNFIFYVKKMAYVLMGDCSDGSLTLAFSIHTLKESGMSWWKFHPKSPPPQKSPPSSSPSPQKTH